MNVFKKRSFIPGANNPRDKKILIQQADGDPRFPRNAVEKEKMANE